MSQQQYWNYQSDGFGTGCAYTIPLEPAMSGKYGKNFDWWRCEACRCAVPLRVENKLQLKCTECGAPIPEKYDTH